MRIRSGDRSGDEGIPSPETGGWQGAGIDP